MKDFWHEYYIINYANYKIILKGYCCIGSQLGCFERRPRIDWYIKESTDISSSMNLINVCIYEISKVYPPKLLENGWSVAKIERITKETYEKICKERGIFSPNKTRF